MNFLSHYYFTQNKNNPYFTLGSVLPDLLRNHGGVWRINPEKEKTQYYSSELASLLKGWELHLRVDQLFHSSPIFNTKTNALRKRLFPVFTRLPIRPFFIAHVGYELILDGLLLEEDRVKAADFYRELTACDPKIVQSFLAIAGINETASFTLFLKSFIDSRYLESYSASKNIVYALDRIGRRVWKEAFNETETHAAFAIVEEYKHELKPTFMAVFKEIEDKLY